ncbi:MAG: tripartite tricarboxylate transporter substrate binding protein, partial [Cupriavidus sp.]|nr:tripartite tricarboxylate transporter substrate binding protein [Cupriavidus sp.]
MSSADRTRRRRLLLKILPLGALPGPMLHATVASAADGAASQRPIALVLPFPPGGSVDIVARQLQPGLKAALG